MKDEVEMDKWIDKREFFKIFIEKHPIPKDITSNQFTKWLKEYASQNKLKYEDKSSGGKYTFILKTIIKDEDEK